MTGENYFANFSLIVLTGLSLSTAPNFWDLLIFALIELTLGIIYIKKKMFYMNPLLSLADYTTLFDAAISGKIEITYAKATKMAEMDSVRLANVRRRLLHEKDVKMRQHKPRPKEEKKPEPVQIPPLEMCIKEMPAFDPDMEFRGLMLTIPTWMNAIARARDKSNIEMVSYSTKKQLASTLRKLEEQIMQTLEVIEQ